MSFIACPFQSHPQPNAEAGVEQIEYHSSPRQTWQINRTVTQSGKAGIRTMNDQKPFPSPNPMLARLRRDNLPPRLAEMWDKAMRDRDEAVLFEVAGNAPEVIEWYYDSFYGEMFHQGRVEVRLKQLARYKLSKMHGCAFCNRGNEKAALAAGVAFFAREL